MCHNYNTANEARTMRRKAAGALSEGRPRRSARAVVLLVCVCIYIYIYIYAYKHTTATTTTTNNNNTNNDDKTNNNSSNNNNSNNNHTYHTTTTTNNNNNNNNNDNNNTALPQLRRALRITGIPPFLSFVYVIYLCLVHSICLYSPECISCHYITRTFP